MDKAGIYAAMPKKAGIIFICIFCFFLIHKLLACECNGTLWGGINKATALIDSCNINYYNDTSFLNELRDSVSSASKCFIGKVVSLKRDTLSCCTETVTVSCERIIKGLVPKTFKALNYPGSGNCSIRADSLVGKKFLCFLGSDTVPSGLLQLGVGVFDCGGGLSGIFVTEKRVVTFVTTCAQQGPFFCSVSAENVDLQQFLDATSLRSAPTNQSKIAVWHAAGGNKVFMVNGRIVARGKTAAGKYFAKITNGNENSVRTDILIK
jgi:hypothetical protein